jgi:hypothetical protein
MLTLPDLASIIYSSVFKGLGHEMAYFFKALKDQICTFCTCARWFLGCLFGKKNTFKDVACFYEKTTNFKDFTESRISTIFQLCF